MKQIKIDGHIFQNNYKHSIKNSLITIADKDSLIRLAGSVICINCSYEINGLLLTIDKEFSIENIVLR